VAGECHIEGSAEKTSVSVVTRTGTGIRVEAVVLRSYRIMCKICFLLDHAILQGCKCGDTLGLRCNGKKSTSSTALAFAKNPYI
jgi:hypothetical protein